MFQTHLPGLFGGDMGVESHAISSKMLKSTCGTHRIIKSYFVAPFCWVQVGPQVDISLVSPHNYIILFFLRLKLFTSVGEMNSSRWQRYHEIPLMKFLKKQEGPFALINPMLVPREELRETKSFDTEPLSQVEQKAFVYTCHESSAPSTLRPCLFPYN